MSYIYLFCLIGCALAQQTVNESNDWEQSPAVPAVQDSPAAQYLGLPAGASSVVPNIRATFSCLGRNYGYFADVDNNCQIFHVCHPSVTASGEPVIYHFSKFCPKTTRFDQRQLTCLSETDPKLISCSDSIRFYPSTESRLSDVRVVQQLENVQQLPEVEQRVEQVVVEEPKNEVFPIKGIQTEIRNEGIPAKTILRSEPLPQPIPQTIAVPVVEQRAEPVVQRIPESLITQRVEPLAQQLEPEVQQRAEPLVQQVVEPIIQRAEPLPVQQSIPEPVVAPVVQRSPVKQNEVSLTNTETLRNTITAPKGSVAPALALRKTQPIVPSVVSYAVPSVPSAPVQISRPVLVESDVSLRRTAPLTQVQRSQQLVQPLYVPQQLVQQYAPLAVAPRVVRPSQYQAIVNRVPVLSQQQPIYYVPIQNYRTVPQYLRTTVQQLVQPKVVRPSQNPSFAQF